MSHQNRVDKNLTFRSCMADAVIATRKAGSVGTKLLKLARDCTDVEMFLARCQAEEDWVLSEEAGQSQELEVPKCWSQAKSDIKRGWELGINPKDVTSYHKMRERKIEVSKSNKKDTNGASGRGRGGSAQAKKDKDVVPVTTVEEALDAGTVVDARTNVIVPDELMPLLRALNAMSQHGRARAIKRFTDEAEQILADEADNHARSIRQRIDAAKG